jgi:Protein of unknown function (DUF995)
MKMIARTLLIFSATISLAGCASMNVFKDTSSNDAQMAAPPPLDLPPAAPTVLTAAQIKMLLTGKSWRWTGPQNNGVTLYASDGTSLVEVTGKGTTGGKWIAKDGQLCESFSPAKFIPQGVPMTCQPFTGTAGNYKVGQASFNLAS